MINKLKLIKLNIDNNQTFNNLKYKIKPIITI